MDVHHVPRIDESSQKPMSWGEIGTYILWGNPVVQKIAQVGMGLGGPALGVLADRIIPGGNPELILGGAALGGLSLLIEKARRTLDGQGLKQDIERQALKQAVREGAVVVNGGVYHREETRNCILFELVYQVPCAQEVFTAQVGNGGHDVYNIRRWVEKIE